MLPFQITFRDIAPSDAIWIATQERIDKLEKLFDKIVRCEVVVSCPHRHRHSDRIYHIQIHIGMSGEDVIINRDNEKNKAHSDVYVAIRDAFDSAERKLRSRVKKMRGEVKAKTRSQRSTTARAV